MEPIITDQQELIITLLRENQELLQRTNDLLEKQERRERRRLILKVIWYTILLGIPMLAYYYLYSTFVGFVGDQNGSINIDGVEVKSETLKELIELYKGQS